MGKLINQVYVIETNEGNFYEEEVEIYGSNVAKNIALKVTDNPKKAKRFADYKEANEIAIAYGFNVLELNFYLEEV